LKDYSETGLDISRQVATASRDKTIYINQKKLLVYYQRSF